jgi:hypothetical protein
MCEKWFDPLHVYDDEERSEFSTASNKKIKNDETF